MQIFLNYQRIIAKFSGNTNLVKIKTQKIEDEKGNITGVYIPIKDWERLKAQFPDIENMEEDLPSWEKDLIDQRLERIAHNPDSLLPIEKLFDVI